MYSLDLRPWQAVCLLVAVYAGALLLIETGDENEAPVSSVTFVYQDF